MKIVIAGAGEVGTHLAKMLSQENHDIVLMDPKEERLSTMSSTSHRKKRPTLPPVSWHIAWELIRHLPVSITTNTCSPRTKSSLRN